MPTFGRSLPMQLMRARERVMQRFRPHLRAHGLTDQQWRVIRALVEAESLEIHRLGTTCVIHPASLSRILPRLEGQGLIRRRTNQADQRRTIVSIAPAGRALFETLAPESRAIYAAIETEVGPELLAEIYEVLDRLIGILGNDGRDPEPEE
jgi:homoprotocatechuate degradation regulator HpaR